jgi:hypothetical protein
MKKQFIRTGLLTLSLTAISFIAGSSVASAQSNNAEDRQTMQVKYLGTDNDALLLNVKYSNAGSKRFSLYIYNETGEILYRNNYSAENFDKKFSIPRLADSESVTFLIRSANGVTLQSYTVKSTTKLTDEVIVKQD